MPFLSDHSPDGLRRAMVDRLVADRTIRSAALEAAFREVPRHLFLPDVPVDHAYRDVAIPTKQVEGVATSSSSQPAMMAIMLEQLRLQRGHRVLEIGAGTGYNAALMAHIVGTEGHVTTIDLDEDLVASARAHLAAAGVTGVEVLQRDGGEGYAANAPYDRIVLTVGAWDIPDPIREQLAPQGRMVLPLSLGGPQKSVAFVRRDGILLSDSLFDCSFMRLRGAFAGPERDYQVGPGGTVLLSTESGARLDAPALAAALGHKTVDTKTGVRARTQEIWSGLSLWLALHEEGYCSVWADSAGAAAAGIPDLLESTAEHGRSSSLGLYGMATLALLSPSGRAPAELTVRRWGPDESVGERLVERVREWHDIGRPSSQGLRVIAYPAECAPRPEPDAICLRRRWTVLHLSWQPSPAR